MKYPNLIYHRILGLTLKAVRDRLVNGPIVLRLGRGSYFIAPQPEKPPGDLVGCFGRVAAPLRTRASANPREEDRQLVGSFVNDVQVLHEH